MPRGRRVRPRAGGRALIAGTCACCSPRPRRRQAARPADPRPLRRHAEHHHRPSAQRSAAASRRIIVQRFSNLSAQLSVRALAGARAVLERRVQLRLGPRPRHLRALRAEPRRRSSPSAPRPSAAAASTSASPTSTSDFNTLEGDSLNNIVSVQPAFTPGVSRHAAAERSGDLRRRRHRDAPLACRSPSTCST